MRHAFLILLSAAVAAATPLWPGVPDLLAQGVTTAVIQGSVEATDGTDLDDTEVLVVNSATGFTVTGVVQDGRFLVAGLEVGGPYTVSVRRLGFHSEERNGLSLTLGEPVELRFVMEPDAIPVDTLHVMVASPLAAAHNHGGTAMTIPDSLLHRLPTLNRDFYDFVRLVPQISTKIGGRPGLSGGGVGFGFNNFLINGVPERSVGAHGTPALIGGKSLPLEAVKEYQVLLAPYDVRYGDFAGAMVNTVTRSGTNQLLGSVFAFARNDRLARSEDDDTSTPYERVQYGFSLGGPIWRDRLHYFVATELQHLTSTAPGPFLGQSPSTTPPVPVSAADVARLDDILRAYGLVAGSGGSVQNRTPLRNIFARLDLAIPAWNSRAVMWANYSRNSESSFSRLERDIFSLSTYQFEPTAHSHMASFQLHTALPWAGAGGHNELLVSYRTVGVEGHSDVHQPIVRVSVPSTSGGVVTLNTGTHEAAQGISGRDWKVYVQNNLTLPLGATHVMTLGVTAERFQDDREGVMGSYGSWTFSSLDALEQGIADRFEIRKDFGSAGVPIDGAQWGAYVGDQWRVGERVSITLGVRADLLNISSRAPYNPAVDSIFSRRTDEMPRRRVHLSPRVGFTWDPSGNGRGLLRGGIGVFTGRPPVAWLRSALTSYGIGIGVLRCGRLQSDRGLPPAFVPDYRAAPTECENGSGLTGAPRGDVDLLSRSLRMAQTLRASLAYDRRLPWGLLASAEALITRNTSDFVFVNLNLEGPQGFDRNGRVLYGTIESSALSAPVLRSDFSEVIDLRNTSRNHSAQVSTSLEKRFSRGMAAMASYTYSRVRDVQTPPGTRVPGIVNWSSRAVSGRHDDLSPGTSLHDIPHRVVLAGTYQAPWKRWGTVFSFSYVGESGGPFTYLAWGARRRGDLNADGSNLNDPIYVPRDAFDTNEMEFSGRSESPGADNSDAAQAERIVEQQTAFDQFIESTPCLRRQRGRILERNSCREPWSHTTILSVRQAVPIAGRAFEAELDAFNVLNLLSPDWGEYLVADPLILEHVGQGSGSPDVAQPIFRFDPGRPEWTTLPTESAFQLQLALRYSF
ncbi:TonB-dependent receptor [soil metagenome]